MSGANVKVTSFLLRAARELRGMLDDERFVQETPLEVEAAMQSALDSVEQAIRCLKSADAGRRTCQPAMYEGSR